MNFGLIGNPLTHSLSKLIHTELFKLKNMDYTYELYQTDDLNFTFDNVLSRIDGFNVTIPYKTDIIKYLNYTDKKVKLYNACNTVVKKNKNFYGYNTDVDGFLSSLNSDNINLANKKILILGSGGVSRMMAFESVIKGGLVYITSRNFQKCQNIKEEIFEKLGKEIQIFDSNNYDFDILLNGTPCGMYPNVLSLPVSFEKIMDIPYIFDTIYNPSKTLLTRLCEYNGHLSQNGINMLVKQAAAAQSYFCGIKYSDEEIKKVVSKIAVPDFSIDKNIIIIGSPGCGKTFIGRELAKILNLKFYDTDAEIERKYGDISNIFINHGEAYFRSIESEILNNCLNTKNLLISTGGGMVENTDVMDKIHNDANNIVLFINPQFDILLKRVNNKNSNRPLLVGDAKKKLSDILKRRIPLYNKYSDFTVDLKKEECKTITAIKCIDKLCGF